MRPNALLKSVRQCQLANLRVQRLDVWAARTLLGVQL